MSLNKIYLIDGADFDYNNHIGLSRDGSNYEYFRKDLISLMSFRLVNNSTDPAKVFNDPSGEYLILENNNMLICKFLPAEVANQSWVTSNQARLAIMDWLNPI